MSHQTVAIRRTNLQHAFEELLKGLESLEHDLFKLELSEDSLFIDNIILRLRIWASEINIRDGTLIVVNKIGPLATKIQSRLDDISNLTKDAGTSSTEKRPLAEKKNQFLESLDFLAMFVEPIKTISTQSSIDGEDHLRSIEAHLRKSILKHWVGKSDWFFLPAPVPVTRFPHLFGAIVANPSEPLARFIPNFPLAEFEEEQHLMRVRSNASVEKSVSKFGQSRSSTFQAPVVYSTGLDPLLAHREVHNHATEVRRFVEKSKSSTAFIIIGVLSGLASSLDRSESSSSGWRKVMPAYRGDLGAEVGVPLRAEAGISLEAEQDTIFALRYHAIRIKRFSKKLEIRDFAIKGSGFAIG